MSTTNLGLDTVPTNTTNPSVPVNDALEAVDAILAGTVTKEFTVDANLTLAPAEYLTCVLLLTDTVVTLTATRDVIFPAHFPVMYVKNSTAQTLTLKKSGQTGVAVAAGADGIFVSGATDVVRASGGSGAVTSVNGDSGVVIVQAPIAIALSDLTTALTTGTNKGYWRAPYAMAGMTYRASLLGVSSSGVVTVDINKNGSTILSTKLTIDASEKTSVTAATPYVATSTTCADDDEFTFDIDTAGTGALGLIVWVNGYAS